MAKGLIAAVLVALCLCSCRTADLSAYVEKTKVEKEIETLRAEFATKLQESNAAILAQKDAVIAAKNAQIQAVADAFYAQSLVFRAILEPTRTDLILTNLAEEGWLAVDHLLPTYEQMMKINARIARELDVTKTTLVDLKKSHDAVVAENAKLVEAEKQKEAALAALEQAKKDAEATFRQTLDAKQQDLAAKSNEIIAQKNADLASKKARDAQLAKLSWGAGILAVCCLAAALFSPVFKTELGIAAIVLAGAAASLPFVEAWMVLAGFGIIAAGIIVWILYRHHNVDKTNTALINGLNEIEVKAKGQYDTLVAPTIAEFTTKYVKGKDGTVTTVPDGSIVKQINAKLMATDRK